MCVCEKQRRMNCILCYLSFFVFLLSEIYSWASCGLKEKSSSVIQNKKVFQKLALMCVKGEGNAKLCVLSH